MSWRRSLAALVAGTLFGVGLAISQMVNPEKVLAFLTVVGDWDPSLAFVMLGAIVVTFFGYRWSASRPPLFADSHSLPTSTTLDRQLVIGAVVFGLGWGLAGYCPGPAIAGLSSGSIEPPVFLAAMIAGGLLAKVTER